MKFSRSFSTRTILITVAVICIVISALRFQSFLDFYIVAQLHKNGIDIVAASDPKVLSDWPQLVFGDNRYQLCTHVHIDKRYVSRYDMKLIKHFRNITRLNLAGTQNASEVIASLRNPSQLQSITVQDSGGTAPYANELPTFESVSEAIFISDERTSCFIKPFLENLPNVTSLTIIGRGHDDITAECILHCPHLHSLRIVDTSITDDLLLRLREVESLREIYLSNTHISIAFAESTSNLYITCLLFNTCAFDTGAVEKLHFPPNERTQVHFINSNETVEEIDRLRKKWPLIFLHKL